MPNCCGGADFLWKIVSGTRTKNQSQKEFLLRLRSGWKDLTALLLVRDLEGTRFFWCAFSSHFSTLKFVVNIGHSF